MITEPSAASCASWYVMPRYRCYCLAADERIIAVAEGAYPDDTVAIMWAEALLDLSEYRRCASIELWRDDGLLHRKRRPVAP